MAGVSAPRLYLCSHEGLKKWARSFSSKEVSHIRPVYRNLVSLVEVDVYIPLMEVLISRWNREHACFRFCTCEMVPTLEELRRLMGLPYSHDDLINPIGRGGKNALSDLLGIWRNHLSLKLGGAGMTPKCSLRFLLSRFVHSAGYTNHEATFTRDEESWKQNRPRVFALAVYGLIIFACEPGLVDSKVSTIVDQLEKDRTKIPKILSEMIRSLHCCSVDGSSPFLGCTALLQVWVLEHLFQFQTIPAGSYHLEDLIHEHLYASTVA